MFLLSLLLALLAAGCNAISSVMQRKANISESDDKPLRLGSVGKVIARPAWLLGFLAMLASFALQATALGIGELAAVEPILAIELPLTLLFGSWLFGHPLVRRDWLGVLAMTAGLAALIGGLAPTGGMSMNVPFATWLVATVAAAGLVAAAWTGALMLGGRARSALFGVAAGAGFGLTASLIKIDVDVLGTDGVAAVFRTWQLYGVAVTGLVSVWLVQNALHSGTLVAAQPGITLLDPIVSVLWGILVYGEQVSGGPLLAVAAVGGAVLCTGVFLLARTSGVHAGQGAPARDPSAPSGALPEQAG